MSRTVCSVFGCTNSKQKAKVRGIQLSFYRFPSRPWEKDRRDAWIRFAKRQNPDGSPWLPSKHARICSSHFVGAKKSEHPHHPNYVPTIFPLSVKTPKAMESQKLRRFERAMTRAVKKASKRSPEPDTCMTFHEPDTVESGVSPLKLPETRRADHFTQVHPEMIDFAINSSLYSQFAHRQPCFLGYQSVREKANALRDLTGVSSQVFGLLLSVLPPTPPKQTSLSLENKLLVTLMKLKSGKGLTFTALAALFNIDKSVVARTFYSIIATLYVATSSWIFFPSKEAVLETMPEAFKSKYKSCRVIIDCTEMKTETPNSVVQKTHMYSNYKGCYTAKYLIGITPKGFISFISKGYGGRATDSFITNDCGILDLLEPGDTIMADKGFPNVNVQDSVVIVMPPFSKGKKYQFSTEEVDQTYDIASVRIHVERAIQRVKMFKILSTRIPINILGILDKIVHVCCVLVNLSTPIIK